MNKKLLVIAVGAAMVAAATTATAGEPTIYAKIHLSVDFMDNGGDDVTGGNNADGTFVSSNSSRLGIKGNVDLDNGQKVVYKYEMSTDYANAGNVAGNRNAYLGMKGGWGQLVAGRHDMPFKTVFRKADLFGDTIGDTRQVLRARGGNDDWADRRDHMLMYTNKFGPVAAHFVYGAPQNGENTADYGGYASYKNAGLTVMGTFETHGKGNLAGDNDSSAFGITGAYKYNNMTFLAGYADMEDVGGDKGDLGQITGYTLGGKLKSGMNTFKLQYTSSETDVSKTEAGLVALGVDHSFSKKTKVYAAYATVMNDDARNAGFTNSGHANTVGTATDDTGASLPGEDATGFSLGMIHKF